MVTRRWLPVVVLVLASVACAVQGPGAQASFAQNSPVAPLRGSGQENRVQNSPEPRVVASTPSVDANATAAVYLLQLKSAQDETARLQNELADEKARAVAVQLSIAEAERETAKYNAMTTQNGIDKLKADAALLAERNRTLELQNEAARLETERLKAQADAESAKTQQLLLLFVGAISVSGFLLMARVIRKRDPVVIEDEQEHDLFPELQKLDRPIIQSGETSLDADTAPPGDPVRFAELLGYAVDDGPLGIGSVMASKIYTNHPEYIPVLEWLRKKDENRKRRTPPLPSLLQTLKNGKLCFTPAGVQWGKDWLYSHEVPPSPPQEIPQNSADNGHAHDDNAVMDAGEVVDTP